MPTGGDIKTLGIPGKGGAGADAAGKGADAAPDTAMLDLSKN
jgi:hypothetical protein